MYTPIRTFVLTAAVGKTVAIGKITKLVESNQDLQNMANLNINSSASAAAL